MNIKSKQIQRKAFFFLNPIFIIAIIAIVGLAIAGPKIMQKLSIIGIADDYLLYDDFEKGYLDDELWDLETKIWDRESSSWNYNPVVKTELCRDTMMESYANDGRHIYMICAGISLLSENNKLNLHHKDFIRGWSQGSTGYIDLTSKDDLKGNAIKIYGNIRESTDFYYKNDHTYRTVSTLKLSFGDLEFFSFNRKASSPVSVNNIDILIEMIPSFEDENIYTIRLNGVDYDVVNVSSASSNKLSIDFIGNDQTYRGAYLKLDYVKYKIPYNCKIQDDEVLVFDSFSEGSTVNITNLAYEPVKFCLDYPIKARSFSEDGIKTDIRGEILQKIVRGQSAIVPPAEEWKVYYITKNTPGIELRCNIDEAYNTNTGICENPSEKAIVGCKLNSDCYIPPGCTGVTSECVNDKCEYLGSCIYQPQKESTSLWDKIMSLGFMQWIAGLFN